MRGLATLDYIYKIHPFLRVILEFASRDDSLFPSPHSDGSLCPGQALWDACAVSCWEEMSSAPTARSTGPSTSSPARESWSRACSSATTGATSSRVSQNSGVFHGRPFCQTLPLTTQDSGCCPEASHQGPDYHQ